MGRCLIYLLLVRPIVAQLEVFSNSDYIRVMSPFPLPHINVNLIRKFLCDDALSKSKSRHLSLNIYLLMKKATLPFIFQNIVESKLSWLR